MHEIVTLQFGQQSNYLGTHFWNTQESYFTYPPEEESPVDHDILFKPGVAPDGSDTFTPRTLIYDLKGAFGSMKKINALYEPEEDEDPVGNPVWRSAPQITRQPQIPKSAYQAALDAGLYPPPLTPSSVRYWSDFSHLYYHPKSLVQLSEFDVNDSLMPFENWDVGMELFEKMERESDLVDRDLRPFVEECDGIQGLQIFTGVDDAWGGWASGWMERLRDEYGKLSIWTCGVGEQGGNMMVPREKRLQQIVNSARSLNVLGEQSSVYIPMSNHPAKLPPYLHMESASPWHIGALQCLALESVTMPSRLRASQPGHATLQELEQTINQTGNRRIAKLEMSIANPEVLAKQSASNAPQPKGSHLHNGRMTRHEDSEERDDGLAEFDIDVFTKDLRIGSKAKSRREHVFGRAEISRGEWRVATGGPDPRDRFGEGPTVQRYTAPLLFPQLSSFPAILDLGSGQSDKIAVYSSLTTSTAVADQIRTIESIASRLVGIDERETLSNGLQTLAEEYDEGWDSGSESGFDD